MDLHCTELVEGPFADGHRNVKAWNNSTARPGEMAPLGILANLHRGDADSDFRIAVIPIIFGYTAQILLQTLLRVNVFVAHGCEARFRSDAPHLAPQDIFRENSVAR